ncbi:proline-rich receptor kinase perk4-like protein [Rutstroemia sp. NJR-2017a WRK4]|nr:proline-rich receptor kinase perk4-like protein [Rutstroemia sp. NJR-2017a WRK4]
MSVPLEKLQLQTLLCERVFVKWMDQSGTPFTLGSCLYDNKQNPKFVMTARCDREGYIHVHFSLSVSVKLAGKDQRMEMLLVVPPDADFASASTPLSISNLDDISFLDASALHEAGISESEHIILVRFKLLEKGFVVTKKKASPTIRLSNSTSDKLIRSLESLSNMTEFSVFIRPNDYARQGLKDLCKRLDSAATGTHNTDIKEMYIQQGAMLVEWGRFIYRNQQNTIPPPYTERPTQLLPAVQVAQSPPVISEREPLSIYTSEGAITETPTRTPFSSEHTPVLHGIFSSSAEDSLDSEVDLDNIEEDSRHTEEDSRYIEMDFDLDSDEEYLANLNSRELSQQFKHDLSVPKMLESKFLEWMKGALLILGNCIRTSNARVFDATRPWCSALLFYDPLDSENTLELWEERNRWLISDMASFIKWANGFHYGAEMTSLLVNDFVKLGNAARTFALRPGQDKYVYLDQKAVCIVRVLAEFSKPDASIGRENVKPVSRKRYTLESHSNKPKRVQI